MGDYTSTERSRRYRERHMTRRVAVRDAQADMEATLRAAMKADRKVLRQREAEDEGVQDTAGRSRRSAHHPRQLKEPS